MAAVGIFVQLSDPGHNTGANRIEVDIADQLLQVGVFLADDGFVSILKQMAATFVTAIKAYRIARQEPSHD